MGKRKATGKKGRGSHRHRAKKRPAPRRSQGTKRGGRSPSITRKIRDTERAIDTIGAHRVKRGSNFLGKTRSLTPTKSGFRAVGRVLKEINKASKLGKKRTFTYDIAGSYIGPDGKRLAFKMQGVGIPRTKDVRPKKGETREEAVNRVVQGRITREIHGHLLKGTYKDYGIKFGPKMTHEEIRETLSRFKKSRDVHFTVAFNRET
jgi:hypothetical protein